MHTKVALTHQLRSELERFWPRPISLFTISPVRSHSPSSSVIQARRRARPRRAASRLSSSVSATEAARRRQSCSQSSDARPDGSAGEAEIKARRAVVLALVTALGQIIAQIKGLERTDHPRGPRASRRRDLPLAVPLPPSRSICAATLLSEIGDCRARYPTADALAGDAGQAAVAIESGKRKVGALSSPSYAADARVAVAVGFTSARSMVAGPRPTISMVSPGRHSLISSVSRRAVGVAARTRRCRERRESIVRLPGRGGPRRSR